jgi:hypothetical protein
MWITWGKLHFLRCIARLDSVLGLVSGLSSVKNCEAK